MKSIGVACCLLLLSAGAGVAQTVSFAPAATVATPEQPQAVAIGDFNGDGKPDLVVTNGPVNTLSILLGTIP